MYVCVFMLQDKAFWLDRPFSIFEESVSPSAIFFTCWNFFKIFSGILTENFYWKLPDLWRRHSSPPSSAVFSWNFFLLSCSAELSSMCKTKPEMDIFSHFFLSVSSNAVFVVSTYIVFHCINILMQLFSDLLQCNPRHELKVSHQQIVVNNVCCHIVYI